MWTNKTNKKEQATVSEIDMMTRVCLFSRHWMNSHTKPLATFKYILMCVSSITQHGKRMPFNSQIIFITFDWLLYLGLDFKKQNHQIVCTFEGFVTCFWDAFRCLWELTLTSINPRCSVLNPPMPASSSFISAVMWIFNAITNNGHVIQN